MREIFALILVSVSGALVGAHAEPARRDEMRLMNQIVPGDRIGSNLRVWDGEGWRIANSAESTRTKAQVLVVNLWAIYCKTCLAEFPILRDMARKIEAEYKRDVQFIFLSETSDPVEMKAFCTKNEKILSAKFPVYLDDNRNVASTLSCTQPGGNLALPTTIILDDQRSVRYAMIGSILERRSELVNAIEDAVQAVKLRDAK